MCQSCRETLQLLAEICTISTLSLISNQVHVSKLPQELLDIIVRHAFDLEKLKHVPEWQIKKDCFDGVCCDIDHCTADEIESMKEDIRKNFWMEQDGDELEAIVHDCLIRRMDAMDWYEVCDERKGQWESYTTMVSTAIGTTN